jgi:hypothetical protein
MNIAILNHHDQNSKGRGERNNLHFDTSQHKHTSDNEDHYKTCGCTSNPADASEILSQEEIIQLVLPPEGKGEAEKIVEIF